MSDGSARKRELTTEEHFRVLDELLEMGCLWVCFTGGEILARPDFLEIYLYAQTKGFFVTLFTNATMITERVADFLAAHPPFDIEVTLYGRTKATYESLTGIPGSFEKCLRGIHLILERKLPLKLKTVALTINKHEIQAMKKFAADLGVEFKFDPMINPRIDCSASPTEPPGGLASEPQEKQQAEDKLTEALTRHAAEWRRLATECAPPKVVEGESAPIYECGGGVNTFALDPYGNMTICVLSHADTFNVVHDGNVREGWEQFLYKVRGKRATRVTKCTHCALRSMCGSCAGTGELENGDAEAPVDFLCRTAHLRAEVFGVTVPAHGDCEYCVDGAHRDVITRMVEKVYARHGTDAFELDEDAPLPAVTSGCGTGSCNTCAVR